MDTRYGILNSTHNKHTGSTRFKVYHLPNNRNYQKTVDEPPDTAALNSTSNKDLGSVHASSVHAMCGRLSVYCKRSFEKRIEIKIFE